MNIEVTPGSRLKDLIENRGYKMKNFAEESGIIPTTLSKFVNNKLPMSNKYIRRAAELLDVTEEYLKCESDDMIPPRYVSYLDTTTSAEKEYNKQQSQLLYLQSFLTTLGIDFIWRAQVADTLYILRNNLHWVAISDTNETEDELDQIELNNKMCQHFGESKMWIEMTFKGRKVSMTYQEFQQWMRTLVAGMEIKIQDKFNVFYDVSLHVADSDIDRALRGELKN